MQPAPNELEALVGELQKKFDRLKVLYEQFFMGIERVEPSVLRKDISRVVITLTGIHLRSPSLRFKVATFIQKWNIYQSYWNRTVRDIEAGRYTRHVITARRRAEREGLPFPAAEMGLHLPPERVSAVSEQESIDRTTVEVGAGLGGPAGAPAGTAAMSQPGTRPLETRTATGASQPGMRPEAAPESGLVSGMSDREVQALHQRVVSAQRATGETNEIRFDTLVAQLNRQVPKLRAEYGCDEVTFDVVSRDGKVRLKPTPRK